MKYTHGIARQLIIMLCSALAQPLDDASCHLPFCHAMHNNPTQRAPLQIPHPPLFLYCYLY